ncbi:probable ubiquitin-like-specific protease 2B isoform X3 [Lotus japonicus]|uniref:probable ubiquitin-like-specific protease 2B isoform X3 n=1 Tax=Lotus japonicus TaxID=34305 RepID=UPI00258D5EE4|nr:probable ubiquitin-like-specific protease 2B isoform X3 [Lotus japonicus]
MMNKSKRRDLEVFDFKEEDEIVKRHLKSKRNRDFLAHGGQVNKVAIKNFTNIPCVDVSGDIFNSEKGGLDPSLNTVEDIFDRKEKNSELEVSKQSNSTRHENRYHFKIDVHYYGRSEMKDIDGGVSSPEISQIGHSGSPSSNDSVDVNSEADVCMNESASTSPASGIAENVSLNGCRLNGTYSSDMDDTNTEVVLHPDYVIYKDNYYMVPKLTFSRCCIKIIVSSECMKNGTFDLEWAADDLIDIKSQFYPSSGAVIIKIRTITSNASQSNHASDTSGIEELKIAVADANWSLRHEQITSLNPRYLAIWNIVPHTDVVGDDTYSRGSTCYFPNFEKPFVEIIYPKGDPDAVSLSKRDVDLLQPDTFINDTIIDFYIKYLKNQIQEEEKPRFHFFNSFFFRKLADMDKNPSSASDGKAAFLRVRKWTRKVNLFEKDYIFIPVNFNLHWSLIVICHPGEVVNFNDKELDKSIKVPCILHMDSIKGSHGGLKNLVQSYLWEEWKERCKDALVEDLSSRFFNMRFLPLELPQQENSYDCGLFLLHYLELFLVEAPFNFNPFKLTKFSNFLNVDWFLPAEAYLKRTLIQRLIFELVENKVSHKMSSSDCSDDHRYKENNENQTGVDCLEINRDSTTSHAGKGIEITLLSGSSSMDPQSLNNSGLVLKELFEQGATAGTVLGQCQSFDPRSTDFRFNGSIFPVEENSDLGDHFLDLTTDPNFQQVARITPQTCSMPYFPRDCGDETCQMPDISLQAEHYVAETSIDESSDASDDLEEIGITENFSVLNEPRSSIEAERGEKSCSPTENPEHFIDISGESNLPTTSVVGVSQHSFCQETPAITLHQAVGDKATCDDGQMIDDIEPDICEEQAAKKRRLMPLQSTSEEIVTRPNL